MRSNIQFCALVVAVSLCGCANKNKWPPPPPPPPGPDPQVSLDIRQSSTGMPGWVTTYGSNGKMYIYQFTGGNKNHGDLAFQIGAGDSNIHITLNTSDFAIGDVPLDNNSNGQLDSKVENDHHAKIHDKNTVALDASYAVKVLDNGPSGPAEIFCHPKIVNN